MNDILDIISRAFAATYYGETLTQDQVDMFKVEAQAALAALESAGYAVVPRERLKEIADWLIGDGTDATSSPNSREQGAWLLAAALVGSEP